GPDTSLWLKRAVIGWVPIAGRKHGQAPMLTRFDAAIERCNHGISHRHAQAATRKEIVLHVHDDQGVALAQHAHAAPVAFDVIRSHVRATPYGGSGRGHSG